VFVVVVAVAVLVGRKQGFTFKLLTPLLHVHAGVPTCSSFGPEQLNNFPSV
jgi:hypothetical protein